MFLGKYRLNILFLISFLLSFPIAIQAQSNSEERENTYTVGGNMFGGFIIKHSYNMGHLANTHPTGFEVFINKNTYGPSYWQQRYNFPDIGVSLSYFNHKTTHLGKNVAAIVYMDFNLMRKRKHDLLFKIGTGLVYSSRPFDVENNFKNNALSSWLSYVMQGRIGYNFRIMDNLKLNTGITLTHFSNGGFKLPNSGVNIVTYNIGFSQLLNNSIPEYSFTSVAPEKDRQLKINLTLSSGAKGLRGVKGYYPFFNFSAYLDKRFNYFSAINFGVDGFYNLALKEEVKNVAWENDRYPDFKKVALVAGHELFVGKVSLLTQLGKYVYNPFKSTPAFYQRYGLKYYFIDKAFSSLTLKTHGGRADVIEWGLGLRM